MEKTIAAISTANGIGGMGVIRISGENACEVAQRVFKSVSNKDITKMQGYTATFGMVFDGDEKIDEAVALVFKAPHSYTGEDVVEISCHGGLYVTKRVLRAVLKNGAAEQLLSCHGLGGKVNKHALILHLSRIARTGRIHGNGWTQGLLLCR